MRALGDVPGLGHEDKVSVRRVSTSLRLTPPVVSAPLGRLSVVPARMPRMDVLKDFPRTALEFERRFATEEDCMAYLRSVRWPDGFRCPRPGCDGRKSWQLRSRLLDECAACGHQVSITAGTLFHGTRKGLLLWFRVLSQFLVAKSGCSAKDLQRQHGVSYQTAWTWLHKVRACMDRLGAKKLSGAVEVDEAYVGGTDDKRHKGRSLGGKKYLLVGAAEDRGPTMGRARLDTASDASGRSLCGFVADNVEPGSTVKTDGLSAYLPLKEQGFAHDRRVLLDPKEASKKLPKIHRVFSLFKRLLLGTYQGAPSPHHSKAYRDEFVFRFNRRSSANRWLLFQRLLASALRPEAGYHQLPGVTDQFFLGQRHAISVPVPGPITGPQNSLCLLTGAPARQ